MPGTAVDTATGTTVTFGTTGFTANIVSAAWSGFARGALDTTHLGSTQPSTNQFGGRTFIPTKLADPGTLALTVRHNAHVLPPIHQAAETITVTFPLVSGDSTPATYAGSGFATSYEVTAATEELMEGVLTVKMTGVWTHAPAT